MSSSNLNLRDPILYRILHEKHHRTGNKWCIYPMYDWAHGIEDSIEGITHSICTLEFEQHRPLYEWFIDNLPVPNNPRQIEFSKLQPTFTLMSKRRCRRTRGLRRAMDSSRPPSRMPSRPRAAITRTSAPSAWRCWRGCAAARPGRRTASPCARRCDASSRRWPTRAQRALL